MRLLVLISVLGLLGLAAGRSAAEDLCGTACGDPELLPEAHAGVGSLEIGVVAQLGFEFLPDAEEGERNGFTASRARIHLEGHLLSENLTYHLSGDALAGPLYAGRRHGPGGENAGATPFLLDASMSWYIPPVGLRITAGRFVPAWGLTMPARPTRIGAIHYPLYVHGASGSLGRFRDLGIAASVEVLDGLTFEAGVFNGAPDGLDDDNDRKDFLAGLLVEPAPGLDIRASSLFGFPEARGALREDGGEIERGAETHVQPVLEARWRDFGLDLMVGGAADFAGRHEEDVREDYLAWGALGHVGYLVAGDWLQLIARAEWWEPSDAGSGDGQLRVTAGPQFFIEGLSSQVRVNYVYDRWESAAAMCRGYLESTGCDDLDSIPEAERDANAVLIMLGVDI